MFGSQTQPVQPPTPPAVRPPDLLGMNPPASPSILQLPSLPEPSASPLKNVDAVKTYLERSGGRPLNPVEIAGLVSMLQDSIDNVDGAHAFLRLAVQLCILLLPDDTQQPFRFSKSPSRAGSPATNSFPTASSSTISSNTTATPKTPIRTLSKNPNGTYKWQGAGSALRNRYHSPAFGSPSSGKKIKLQPPETAKGGLKRRRVGQDAETSSPQKTSASRQPSAEPTDVGPSTNSSTSSSDVKDTGANRPPQSKPQLNGINTSRLNKGTTPAVSSPLRQAWGHDDFPSPNSSPSSAPKPSRAAAFMTELIREATPPKKPDIANPYQTASPVKIVKPPPKKSIRKPSAASKQPPTGEKEKQQPEMSMQAIIEATLPKVCLMVHVCRDWELTGRLNAIREVRGHGRLPTCLPLPMGPLGLVQPTPLRSLPVHRQSAHRSHPSRMDRLPRSMDLRRLPSKRLRMKESIHSPRSKRRPQLSLSRWSSRLKTLSRLPRRTFGLRK